MKVWAIAKLSMSLRWEGNEWKYEYGWVEWKYEYGWEEWKYVCVIAKLSVSESKQEFVYNSFWNIIMRVYYMSGIWMC